MGRATVVEEIGDGQYRIALDYGKIIVDARVAVIDARIAVLDTQIDELGGELSGARGELSVAIEAVNTAIDDLRTAIQGGGNYSDEENAAKEATKTLIDAQKAVDVLQSKIDVLNSEKSALTLEKTTLQSLELETEIESWCVDFSLRKESGDDVATIEVPGDPTLTLIAPSAPTPVDADGVVFAREVQRPHQVYFNTCMFNGWQKWMPLYRIGEITALVGDVCNVALDEAASTGQNLGINQTPTIENVPIEYMSCHGAVFEVGDRVVVAFTDQDWAQPKVIGFETNPRPCAGLLLHWDDYTLGTPNHTFMANYGLSGWLAREISDPSEYGDRGWARDALTLSWSENLAGSGRKGVFHRGSMVWGFESGESLDVFGIFDRSTMQYLLIMGAWMPSENSVVVFVYYQVSTSNRGMKTVVVSLEGGIPISGAEGGEVTAREFEHCSHSLDGSKIMVFDATKVYLIESTDSGAVTRTELRYRLTYTTNRTRTTTGYASNGEVGQETDSGVYSGVYAFGVAWQLNGSYEILETEFECSWLITKNNTGASDRNATLTVSLTGTANGAPISGSASYSAHSPGVSTIPTSDWTINSIESTHVLYYQDGRNAGYRSSLIFLEQQTYGSSDSTVMVYDGSTLLGSVSGRLSPNLGLKPSGMSGNVWADLDPILIPAPEEQDYPDQESFDAAYDDWYNNYFLTLDRDPDGSQTYTTTASGTNVATMLYATDVLTGVRVATGQSDFSVGYINDHYFLTLRTLSGNVLNVAKNTAIDQVFPAGIDPAQFLSPIVPY